MRRFHQLLSAAAFSAIIAPPTFAADCPQPGPAPVIPDGANATLDQMKTAQGAVQSYVNLLQSIQDCDEAKIKMAPRGAKADDLQKLRDAGNAAIDQANALRNAYIAQKKIFQNRAPSTAPASAPK